MHQYHKLTKIPKKTYVLFKETDQLNTPQIFVHPNLLQR